MTTPFAVVFWLMMLLYALAVGGQLASRVFASNRFVTASTVLVATGLALHTILVAWRWIATGHVPTIGTFENALLGAWFIAAMALWAAWRERHPLVAAATLPFALLALGGGALSDTSQSPLVASLNSSWLLIHIFFAWLGYGAYTVSCGAGIVYLVKTRRGAPPARDEELAQVDELMFRTAAFGFVNDGIMIAAGAIWAKDLWGSYWSWDPVETWSLITWLVYGIALHLRITLGWKGRRLAWLLVFAVIAVLISAWGVNFVMSGSAHVFNVD